jgi:ribonuclease J
MNKVKEVSSKYKYCFVLASSSNIDKIQSIAGVVCKGKYFLMDEFQKHILEIAETYDNYTFHKNMTFGHNIKESNSEVYKEYVRKHPDKTCLIYSMWSGYLEYKGIRELYDLGRNKRMIDCIIG